MERVSASAAAGAAAEWSVKAQWRPLASVMPQWFLSPGLKARFLIPSSIIAGAAALLVAAAGTAFAGAVALFSAAAAVAVAASGVVIHYSGCRVSFLVSSAASKVADTAVQSSHCVAMGSGAVLGVAQGAGALKKKAAHAAGKRAKAAVSAAAKTVAAASAAATNTAAAASAAAANTAAAASAATIFATGAAAGTALGVVSLCETVVADTVGQGLLMARSARTAASSAADAAAVAALAFSDLGAAAVASTAVVSVAAAAAVVEASAGAASATAVATVRGVAMSTGAVTGAGAAASKAGGKLCSNILAAVPLSLSFDDLLLKFQLTRAKLGSMIGSLLSAAAALFSMLLARASLVVGNLA